MFGAPSGQPVKEKIYQGKILNFSKSIIMRFIKLKSMQNFLKFWKNLINPLNLFLTEDQREKEEFSRMQKEDWVDPGGGLRGVNAYLPSYLSTYPVVHHLQ